MPGRAAASDSHRRAPAARPRTRRKALPARQHVRWQALRWLAVAAPVLFVFLAGLVLDTAALLRLFWACLGGYFGVMPRAIAFAVLLVGASPALRAAYLYLAVPERATVGKTQRRTGAERTRKPERPPRITTDRPSSRPHRTRVAAQTD